MAIMQIFKCSIPSAKVVFVNGKEGNFINGKYMTDNEAEITYLKDEIAKGHPHIYIDDKEKEVDTEADPLAALKEKLRNELLAELANKSAEANKTDNDRGNSGKSPADLMAGVKLNVANSNTIVAAASGSSSGAALVPLVTK